MSVSQPVNSLIVFCDSEDFSEWKWLNLDDVTVMSSRWHLYKTCPVTPGCNVWKIRISACYWLLYGKCLSRNERHNICSKLIKFLNMSHNFKKKKKKCPKATLCNFYLGIVRLWGVFGPENERRKFFFVIMNFKIKVELHWFSGSGPSEPVRSDWAVGVDRLCRHMSVIFFSNFFLNISTLCFSFEKKVQNKSWSSILREMLKIKLKEHLRKHGNIGKKSKSWKK